MIRQAVDLASHINRTVERGHPADFPEETRPVFCPNGTGYRAIPRRLAVVRQDTETPLSVVSDRYSLIPHQAILESVEKAIAPLDLGLVPRGIYVDRRGARMRALFKFPSLARPVSQGDDICPCLKIQNTYDGSSRIAVHIGAFRFVCTNLAVGGGGVFAGGFMSVHAGEIPIEEIGKQLAAYLKGFDAIVAIYRFWTDRPLGTAELDLVLEGFPRRPAEAIRQECPSTVYRAYNAATRFATHEMRSYRTAFELLERVNSTFQERFPLPAA